jgi:hypothetical protein
LIFFQKQVSKFLQAAEYGGDGGGQAVKGKRKAILRGSI